TEAPPETTTEAPSETTEAPAKTTTEAPPETIEAPPETTTEAPPAFSKSNKSAKSPKAKTTMNVVQSKNKTPKNPMAKVSKESSSKGSVTNEATGVGNLPGKADQVAVEARAEAEVEASQAVEADPDLIRARCINAVERAFPRQGWATESSLKAFAANVASGDRKSETVFARPMGGGPEFQLRNFTGDALLGWFEKELNPEVLRYTEIITSEVAVSKNVCSMDTLFLAVQI
ncbi:hypothetical protein ACHAWF_000144, partial [Thalassiosira exigua]